MDSRVDVNSIVGTTLMVGLPAHAAGNCSLASLTVLSQLSLAVFAALKVQACQTSIFPSASADECHRSFWRRE